MNQILQDILFQFRQITAAPVTNPDHALALATFYVVIIQHGRTWSEAKLQEAHAWICNVEVS